MRHPAIRAWSPAIPMLAALLAPIATAETTPPSCNDPASLGTLETTPFPWAGLSLELSPDWTRFERPFWVTFQAKDATVEIRRWARREGDPTTLSGHLEHVREFEAMLARTVKESQYHSLQGEGALETSRGLAGWWAVYGVAPTMPQRLAYYLIDEQGRLISIGVRFHRFDTEATWGCYDRLVRQGLAPLARLSATAGQAAGAATTRFLPPALAA